MKILVTGSNGFIGRHLVQTLAAQYQVVGHGRVGSVDVNCCNAFYGVDVCGESNWKECLDGVDVVLHLASVAHDKANNSQDIVAVNVDGAVNLAKQAAAAGVKRFIFISSIGVLGNKTNKPLDENSIVAPHSKYSKSKLAAENALVKLAKETGFEVVIIRPVLVYGKWAPGNFGKLLSLIKKTPVLPFGLSNNLRSFISIDNLVGFIALCVKHPKAGNEMFCISDGCDVSIKEFTDAISKGISKRVQQLPVPTFLFRILAKLFGRVDQVEQLVGDLQVEIKKARNILGWVPVESMAQAMNKLK